MSSAAAGAAAAAVAAAAAQASVVLGPIIVVDRENFIKVLSLEENPLVVEVEVKERVFSKKTKYIYVTSIRGLVFMVKTNERIDCKRAVVVRGNKLVLPQFIRSAL